MLRKKITIALTSALWAILSAFLWPSSRAQELDRTANQVTFNKDVAPLFYAHCTECHRPGEASPMSLLTYKEARPWAKSIREKVLARAMPPWHADPQFGEFANDRRLSQQAINTIVAWVEGGALEGETKDLPPVPRYSSEWKIGKPDLVLTMAEEYSLDAPGADEYIDFVLPTNLTEQKWIKAIEIRPGNKQVVHHAIAFIQTPALAAAKAHAQSKPPADSVFYRDGTLQRVKPDAPVYDDGCAAPNGGLAPGAQVEMVGPSLGFYAPGKDIARWPANGARALPAGAKIVLQMHYAKTTGKVEKDRTSVGLVFAKAPPEITILSQGGLNQFFKIPAGAPQHEVTACYDFKQAARLLSLMPHMHKRGKAMRYEIVQPDGQRRTLLWVPAYDFNWQTQYTFKEPVFVPKGSRLLLTAHYDNSARNRNNPDPTKTVRWGNPTYDEMLVGYFEYFVTTPERAAVNVARAILNSYVGTYEVFPGTLLTITSAADGLLASSSGLPALPLFAETETKFFFKTADVQLTFVKDEKGAVNEVVIDRGGRAFRARRLKEPAAPERAQSSGARVASQTRSVQGQVLTSTALPTIRLKFDEALKYLGQQSFTLHGVAQAEQHYFVEADAQRRIKRMFIVQFEGFLPDNTNTYDYRATKTVRLGEHDYLTNAAAVPNVAATLKQNPDTDAARAAVFLESKGYRHGEAVLFQRFIRVVDEAKRHEFILIYIEDLSGTGLTAAELAQGGRAAEQRERILQELQNRALKSLEVLK